MDKNNKTIFPIFFDQKTKQNLINTTFILFFFQKKEYKLLLVLKK